MPTDRVCSLWPPRWPGGGLPLGALGALNPEATIQEGVLRSERLADAINAEFDLDERYKTRNREERLRAWQKNLGTQTNQQGLLTVSVTDKDPEFCSGVVTRLIGLLDEFNREVRSTGSRRTREFVEGRLGETEMRLHAVEDSLVGYQERNQSLALSPSTESVVAAGAQILSQRLELEMEIALLRGSLFENSPAVREKRARINALNRELERLPELGSGASRLLREVRVYERTFGFLTAQLEEARIEEARDTPTVDVLDAPRVPEEKSWPIRSRWTIVACVLSFLTALILAKCRDALAAAREAARSVHA